VLFGGTKRSFIFGGGIRGGAIDFCDGMVRYFLSGDLLPCVLERGGRAGIREGLVCPLGIAEGFDSTACGLPRMVLKFVGVFDRLPVDGAPLTVPLRLGAADALEFVRPWFIFDGVFDLGGGTTRD
jgi:hypothetical protein